MTSGQQSLTFAGAANSIDLYKSLLLSGLLSN